MREQEIISLQQERISLLKTPDLYSQTERIQRNVSPTPDKSTQQVLEFVKRELPISSIQKLPKAIIMLKQQAEKYSYVRTFHQKASSLYATLHPNDPKPSLNALWKWIKSKSKGVSN